MAFIVVFYEMHFASPRFAKNYDTIIFIFCIAKIVDIEVNVRALQACLFPPQLTTAGSYFSNFFVKTCQTEIDENDDELKIKIKESYSLKEIFPAARDTAFVFQPPRWPTECQVADFYHIH